MKETGLERWWVEHSELDRLVNDVADAMADSALSRASAALEELAFALEDHFEVEEQTYFPLVRRLSSKHEPVVRAALLGHSKIRQRLEQLRSLVDDGEVSQARRGFSVLLERFQTHEASEAKLIAELAGDEGLPVPETARA